MAPIPAVTPRRRLDETEHEPHLDAARYFIQTPRAPAARQAPRTTPPDIAPKIPSHTPIRRRAGPPLGRRAPIPPILVRAKCPARRERASRIDLAHRRKNKRACGKPHVRAEAPRPTREARTCRRSPHQVRGTARQARWTRNSGWRRTSEGWRRGRPQRPGSLRRT